MKSILVPRDLDTMKKLDIDQAPDEDLFKINVDDKEIYHLFNSGFVDKVNQNLNVIIDDFEYEEIIGNNELYGIKELSYLFSVKYKNYSIYKKIYALSLIAIDRKTGLFFFF
ncbi:hypothetical protein [Neisseria shayeganii]|uniref:Uncharacterized protein n=1 Tax=Neisseria shayeganii 871 TaxID=1032488 RepID=G4CKI3_9NEIS|nr:hypothetical protein [Neisseria shayeganii]EGY51659.1 hypothetical protein HMPREF9371_2123 [Neisseria shayeganii 871]